MSVKLTPAPGYVQVVQNKSTGGEMIGVSIAAKENPMHEGTVLSIGFVPERFKPMKLKVGMTVTFARFNAVKGANPGEDWLFVGMQHIVCKKEDDTKLTLMQKIKGWFNFSWFAFVLGGGFAAGWTAKSAWPYVKQFFGKKL